MMELEKRSPEANAFQRFVHNARNLLQGGSRGRLMRKRGSLTGVCAGLGDYFEVNPAIFRLAFVISGWLSAGLTLLVYLGLAMALPKEEAEARTLPADKRRLRETPEAGTEGDPATREALLLCPTCDTVAKPFARFCHKCGTALTSL